MISGGNVSVELNLDYSKFEKQENRLKDNSKRVALNVEKNYDNLGKSVAEYYTKMADAIIAEHRKVLKDDTRTAKEKATAYYDASRKMRNLDIEMQAASERTARANKANAEYQMASMRQREASEKAMWSTLGIKSKAYYDSLKADAARAHKELVSREGMSAKEIERINAAHRKRMTDIDKEYYATHSRSWRQINRDLLAAYASLYIVTSGLRVMVRFLKEGLEYSDQMKKSAIAIAATIASQKGTENTAENYRKAYEYSRYLVQELRKVDKLSFANYENILIMNRAMELQGVHLDVNNKKQVETFTALTNAIALYTDGQDQAKQASQEMRSLFTGVVREQAQVAMMLDNIIKQSGKYANGLKDIVRLSSSSAEVFEKLAPFLEGINQSTGDISNTWESAVTSFETSWGRLKALTAQALFADAGKDVKAFSEKMENASRRIALRFRGTKDTIYEVIYASKYLWMATGNTLLLNFSELRRETDQYNKAMKELRKTTFDFKAEMDGLTEVSKEALRAGVLKGELFPNLRQVSDDLGNVYFYYKKIVDAPETPPKQLLEEKLSGLRKEADFRKQIADDEYQKAIRHADRMKKLGQSQGVYEIDNLRKTTKAKLMALDTYEIALTNVAAEQSRLDAKQAAEDGRSFDLSKNMWERIRAIRSEVLKRRQDILDQEEVATEDATKKMTENYSEMYQTISKYSTESYNAQRAAIVSAFTENSRFTKASVADQAILQAALQKTLAVFDATFAKGKAEERMGALSPISEDSWVALQDSLSAQADLMDDAFANQLEKEQWLTSRLLEEWGKRKDAQAEYYDEINGFAKQAYDKRVEALQAQRDLEITQGQDVKAANAKYTQAIMAANEKRFDSEHAGTLKVMAATQEMFGNAKALMSENSGMYKAIHSAEMTMKAAQIAIEVQKQFTIATSAATEAGVFPMQMAMRKSLALAAGVEATVSAGTGDPYTAPARMAAMAAAVSGVLALIGVGFTAFGSKGGSNFNPNTYATGTGTALGSSEASNSASKTLDLLKDIHAYEYAKLVGIYEQVRDLNSNITGLVRGLVKAGGDFSAMRDVEGAETWNKIMTSAIGYGLGGMVDLFTGGIFDLSGGIANAVSSVFGGETTVSMIGKGIQIGGVNLGDLLNGTVTTIGQFFVDMKKTVDGGWFHSDKTSYWSEFENLDEGTNRLLTTVFTNLGATMFELAEGFGMDITDAIANYKIDIGKIDLMGKSGDEISEILTSVFSAFGDQMVDTLFGEIVSQYQDINEGLLETAVRLLAEKEQIVRILEITNMSYDSGIESAIELSQSLISLAGDMDVLTDAASTYYKAFFDDSERALDQQQQLNDVMVALGYTLPGSRMGFRNLIEGLDLTTDSGQAAYVSLLQLSSMADEYYSYLEDLQADALDTLKDQISAWEDQLSAVQDALKTWGSTTAEATLMTIEEIIARTRNGVLTASDELSAALSAATSLTTDTYQTGIAYDLDQARMRASLIELEAATKDQLSIDEYRLSLMEQQTTSLNDLVVLATETNAILTGATGATSSGATLTIGASNDSVVAELRELKTLIKESGDSNRLYIKRVSDHLDDWDGSGLPEARS